MIAIPFFGTMRKLTTKECPGPVELLRPVAFSCRFVTTSIPANDADFAPEAA